MFASMGVAAAHIQIFGFKIRFGVNLEAEIFLLVKFHIHVQVWESWGAYHLNLFRHDCSGGLSRLPNIHGELDVLTFGVFIHSGLEGDALFN